MAELSPYKSAFMLITRGCAFATGLLDGAADSMDSSSSSSDFFQPPVRWLIVFIVYFGIILLVSFVRSTESRCCARKNCRCWCWCCCSIETIIFCNLHCWFQTGRSRRHSARYHTHAGCFRIRGAVIRYQVRSWGGCIVHGVIRGRDSVQTLVQLTVEIGNLRSRHGILRLRRRLHLVDRFRLQSHLPLHRLNDRCQFHTDIGEMLPQRINKIGVTARSEK
jgi:hypothetical protein